MFELKGKNEEQLKYLREKEVYKKKEKTILKGESMSIYIKESLGKAIFGSFIQPFSILFEDHDLHVMLYFEGHKEYEAAEAMSRMGSGNEPSLIRAILTRHDQTQIDYINDKELVEQLQKREVSRETYYTDIQYDWDLKKSRPEVFLSFRTINDEIVDFNIYTAAKPMKRHGGLTDPEGHAKDSTLPVMYRGKSTLAGRKSSILIDGISYKIPYMIRIPIFFTGMKGYYTEEFLIGVVLAGEKQLRLKEAPSAIDEGEKWIYKTGSEEKQYMITEVNNNKIEIASEKEVIKADIVNGEIGISEISFLSHFNQERLFSLSFFPSLVFGKENVKEMEFSISIDDSTSLVAGVLHKEETTDGIIMRLIPKEPEWAEKRIINTEIRGVDDEIVIRTKVGEI